MKNQSRISQALKKFCQGFIQTSSQVDKLIMTPLFSPEKILWEYFRDDYTHAKKKFIFINF